MSVTIKDIVFVGFNNRVAALDRERGDLVWEWKSPRGSGYVSVLLADEKRLIVSVSGYTYCLDPLTGAERWFNELKGLGTGVASIAAWGAGHTPHQPTIGAAEETNAAAASAAT